MKRRFPFSSGFTLLELLVVISIIGILVAMGTVAFSTAQRKARDSKRRSDMQQIQKAFEQYYADNGTYAATCATMASATYMPGGLPTDPKNVSPNVYNTSTACATTDYCVCGVMESAGSGNANAPSGSTCSFASGGSYYCVKNLQ